MHSKSSQRAGPGAAAESQPTAREHSKRDSQKPLLAVSTASQAGSTALHLNTLGGQSSEESGVFKHVCFPSELPSTCYFAVRVGLCCSCAAPGRGGLPMLESYDQPTHACLGLTTEATHAHSMHQSALWGEAQRLGTEHDHMVNTYVAGPAAVATRVTGLRIHLAFSVCGTLGQKSRPIKYRRCA